MNLVEWLIYAAALEQWRRVGGFGGEHYHDIRLVVLSGDYLSGYRSNPKKESS